MIRSLFTAFFLFFLVDTKLLAAENEEVGFKKFLLGATFQEIQKGSRLNCKGMRIPWHLNEKTTDKHLLDLYKKSDLLHDKATGDTRCDALDYETIAGMQVYRISLSFFNNRLEYVEVRTEDGAIRDGRNLSLNVGVGILREGLTARYGAYKTDAKQIPDEGGLILRNNPLRTTLEWSLPSATIRMEYDEAAVWNTTIDYKSSRYDAELKKRMDEVNLIDEEIEVIRSRADADSRAKRASDF